MQLDLLRKPKLLLTFLAVTILEVEVHLNTVVVRVNTLRPIQVIQPPVPQKVTCHFPILGITVEVKVHIQIVTNTCTITDMEGGVLRKVTQNPIIIVSSGQPCVVVRLKIRIDCYWFVE